MSTHVKIVLIALFIVLDAGIVVYFFGGGYSPPVKPTVQQLVVTQPPIQPAVQPQPQGMSVRQECDGEIDRIRIWFSHNWRTSTEEQKNTARSNYDGWVMQCKKKVAGWIPTFTF